MAVKVPIGCNVIDARWVFKWKADKTGKIVKAKAKLVAKSFKQKYGVDYLETFSPNSVGVCVQVGIISLGLSKHLLDRNWITRC